MNADGFRTGEVRPDDNLTGAYARNSSHKDSCIFVRFFISEKSIGYFYALSVFWLRVFYIAGILKIEKTFGGDAEISFTRKGENDA